MNNQKRVLAQALTIDAWHEPLRTDGGTSAVRVELSFQQGRVGGDDPDFPFTFNIGVKRALLTVKLERPLELDRNTVARPATHNQIELTRVLQAKEEFKKSSSLGGKISADKLLASMSADLSTSSAASHEDHAKLVRQLPRIIATPRPEGAHAYSWSLTPSYEDLLEGQPWNPVTEPRFFVKSLEKKGIIDPVISATISCDLQDIDITDLKLKDQGIGSIIKEMAFNRVNEAAAIQHLKFTLRDMNLDVGSFHDRFSHLIIGDVLSVAS